MRHLKVLLVYPSDPPSYFNPGRWTGEPLALEYLGAAVRLEGQSVSLVDLRFEKQGLEEILGSNQPDVVVTTAYTMHVKSACGVLKIAKELQPKCITLVGGHHASLMPEDFFHPYVDYVVMGEGVNQFRKILQELVLESDVCSKLPGVWSRQGERFDSGGPIPPYKIDSLPQPARDLTQEYRKNYRINSQLPTALLLTAVGCAYRCNFCAQWRLLQGGQQARAIAAVIDELQDIDEEQVFLTDDEPFSASERMFELAAAIAAAGIKKRFYTYCRANDFIEQKELMVAWRDAGLIGVSMGIEAVSQRELDSYNKRLRLSQVESAFRIAADIGIEVVTFFIIDPLSSHKDFERLSRFIQRHKVKNPLFSILTPLPGTTVLKNFEAITEFDSNGRPNWNLFDFQTPVTKTSLPKDQFMQLYRRLWWETGGIHSGASNHM